MVTILTVAGVVTSLLVAGTVVGVLWRANRALESALKARKADLDRTSKILIEKNLELVDQNLLQQKMLESKDDFIHIVSHQLRTPATELKWGINSMANDTAIKLSAAQQQSIATLSASIEQLIRLINHIVRLVSVEQGAFRLAVVAYDPNEVVQASVQSVKKEFASKPMTMSVATEFNGTITSIDPDSLGMVVKNLVENAFLYTPAGGTVTVRTQAGAEGSFVVVVSDNGIGIPREQQQFVFVKFRRGADAVRTNAKGSGLGLYIVKKIIDQHRGEVSFVSAAHEGTTFTVSLPRTAALRS